MVTTNSISVVIPTYRDTSSLKKCLKALHSQNYPSKYSEIIVVNNDPEKSLHFLKKKFPRINILSESKIGSYAARNKGVQFAKNEIIAFTDSDCIADSEWVGRANAYFKLHPKCSILGGMVCKKYLKPNHPSIIELYDVLSFHLQERYVKKYHFAVTANVFIKKAVFNKVGYFNESLRSGGDSEFGNRAWSSGYKICYDPSIVVEHQAINSLHKLKGKIRRITGGKFQKNHLEQLSFIAFITKITRDSIKTVFGVSKIKNQVSIRQLILLCFLEIYVQIIILSEFIKLRLGGEVLRSY